MICASGRQAGPAGNAVYRTSARVRRGPEREVARLVGDFRLVKDSKPT
jgi:hypothetical protein